MPDVLGAGTVYCDPIKDYVTIVAFKGTGHNCIQVKKYGVVAGCKGVEACPVISEAEKVLRTYEVAA